jgi:hypothetical protein
MANPLDSYISCARFVFSVEPTEPSEDWEEYDDFCSKLREFYESILCIHCNRLLKDPCTPKKQHFSCQHRVCLDCIGKSRQTTTPNCKMCRDFTLFEKSTQTKLILGLYQELCELIKGSWIYDYIQQRMSLDTGQASRVSLVEIIEKGINYGRNMSIIVDDSSSSSSSSPQSSGDENSNSSDTKQQPIERPPTVPFSSQTFPKISPLPPVSPKISTNSNSNSISVQSPEQITTPPAAAALPIEPMPAAAASIATPSLPIVSSTSMTVPHIVQYSSPIVVQSQHPSTSAIKQTAPSHQLLKTSPFISHVPMRVKPPPMTQATTPMNTKSIMSPMKIQQSAPPTIYSVMYTGSGNKITLKRKTPDESSPSSSAAATSTPTSEIKNISNNVSSDVCVLAHHYYFHKNLPLSF